MNALIDIFKVLEELTHKLDKQKRTENIFHYFNNPMYRLVFDCSTLYRYANIQIQHCIQHKTKNIWSVDATYVASDRKSKYLGSVSDCSLTVNKLKETNELIVRNLYDGYYDDEEYLHIAPELQNPEEREAYLFQLSLLPGYDMIAKADFVYQLSMQLGSGECSAFNNLYNESTETQEELLEELNAFLKSL